MTGASSGIDPREGLGLLAERLSPTDRVALKVTTSGWEVARILEPHPSLPVLAGGSAAGTP